MRKLAFCLVLGLGVTGCERNTDIVVTYGRENNSGTYAYFMEHVLNKEDFDPNVLTLPGTAAVINAVSKNVQGIGYGGIGYLEGVKAVKVARDDASPAFEPTLENVVSGKYPISRYLYLYTAGEPDGTMKHYIDWARAAAGQDVCKDVGYFPLPEDQRAKDPGEAPKDKATITVKGSDTMVILGQKWAEQYMKLNPHVTVQITGGGSGTGIAALIEGATNICQASRPMKDKERALLKEKRGKEAVEIRVALDGIAVFVHKDNPVETLTLPQLKGIYTGKIKGWGELGVKSAE